MLTGVSKIAISVHYLIYGVRKFPSLKANTRIIEFRDFKNLNERAYILRRHKINWHIESSPIRKCK